MCNSRCTSQTIGRVGRISKRKRAKIEGMTEEYLRNARTSTIANRRGIIKIPIVVHVVWNTEEQNISDEQIHSQIDALNRDFRKANPDISKVPPQWGDLTADSQIEFFLATMDPDDNPTTGITRTFTTVTLFDCEMNNVKSKTTGGADPWPTDKYLNLWVCPRLISDGDTGVLGYAQFPGAPPETDGVVIRYTEYGTMGTATSPYNLGRTATHEIGHWLNLYHIWGNEGSTCGDSDKVADTPNQEGPYREPSLSSYLV